MNKLSLVIATLLITALLVASCGGSATSEPTTTETLEEILAQAANVEMVKYDCVMTGSGGELITKVWFKGNKMKTESSFEGQVSTYLLMDTGDIYRWDSPENEPQEVRSVPEQVFGYVDAISFATWLSGENLTIIGSENIDGKDCLVVEYASDDTESTMKAWLWKEKRFLVRLDLISPEGTTTIEFRNIDFGDIPDSVFELPTASTDTTQVTFPDENLEAAIRHDLGKAPDWEITVVDIANLTELVDGSTNGITDLSGLEYCTNLTYLNLYGDNQISDLSPLSSLTNLTRVDLPGNQISDISPLSSLTNLNVLYLERNEISDISSLSSLTNLTLLNLNENQISDISPLSSLTKLTQLRLHVNQISDISPLTSLTSLSTLTLHVNQISDISPLTSLANLSFLNLQENQISNISALTGLTNLNRLTLANNNISDISPLSSLKNLDVLTLGGNQISDISPLVENSGLSTGDIVGLNGNPLNTESINVHIPELIARGVDVTY